MGAKTADTSVRKSVAAMLHATRILLIDGNTKIVSHILECFATLFANCSRSEMSDVRSDTHKTGRDFIGRR